jgi:hypothetical protein
MIEKFEQIARASLQSSCWGYPSKEKNKEREREKREF